MGRDEEKERVMTADRRQEVVRRVSGNGGPKRILVVDDDPIQLDTICRGLTLYGYECLRAAHAGKAMEYLNQPTERPISLLLTDMTIPGRSGYELLLYARALQPNLPAIVVTGLSLPPDILKVRRLGVPVLQKPFDPEMLSEAIYELLESRYE
jgi:CheY-like chemotaxis protein